MSIERIDSDPLLKSAEQQKHTEKIRKVAYHIYERRVLKDSLGEDPYGSKILKGVPPEELAKRDFLLAKIWVESGDANTLELFTKDLNRLREAHKKRDTI